MIDIVATAAVSGLLTGTGIGFALARPWQDWTIKRINKDRADLRRENDLKRTASKSLARQLGEANEALASVRSDRRGLIKEVERLERQLAASGKPDTQAVSDYMREIGARGNASPARLSNRKRSAASQRKAA